MIQPTVRLSPSLGDGGSSPVGDLGNVYLLPWEDIGDQYHALQVGQS